MTDIDWGWIGFTILIFGGLGLFLTALQAAVYDDWRILLLAPLYAVVPALGNFFRELRRVRRA